MAKWRALCDSAPVSLLPLVATCAKATEDLVAAELTSVGATVRRVEPGAVHFAGDLGVAYRACLWSRVASRILLGLAEFPAADPEALYAGVRGVDWQRHLGPEQTLAVDFTSTRSQLTHSRFGAQKVKDAVVDQLREATGSRPSVERRRPDVRLNVHVERDVASVSLDLSGESLHRRGYRDDTVLAPLKENLAAAVLLRSRWPEAAAQGLPLVDLMCGSGTLPIEAALMACDAAPGLLRDYWGFVGWRGHDPALFTQLRAAAAARRRVPDGLVLVGYDADARAVRAAQGNAEHAGVGPYVRFERCELTSAAPPEGATAGHVVVNPPYGERLGEESELVPLYESLGRILKERFGGYQAHVLSASQRLTSAIGLRQSRENTLFNGPLECRLLHFEVYAERKPPKVRPPPPPPRGDFANRLKKNLKNLGRWAEAEGVSCYRVYDADIPEYAVAVDRYERFAHVQEYAPPASIDPRAAEQRLGEVMAAVPEVLGVRREDVFLKVRRRQKGGGQYERHAEVGRFHEVHEGGHTFFVNFTDYLDTGLFLDHRPTRRRLGELAAGKHFLNLFCYTATATVYAARGGAQSTTSVDLSNTYLDWAAKNFERNGLPRDRHRLVRADVRAWLEEERGRYDLVFLDPPTFSTSSGMEGTLDIQRDHVELLRAVMRLLAPEGLLLFSTNFRRFRLDAGGLPDAAVEDITAATIPPDFERNQRIHKAFLLKHR